MPSLIETLDALERKLNDRVGSEAQQPPPLGDTSESSTDGTSDAGMVSVDTRVEDLKAGGRGGTGIRTGNSGASGKAGADGSGKQPEVGGRCDSGEQQPASGSDNLSGRDSSGVGGQTRPGNSG